MHTVCPTYLCTAQLFPHELIRNVSTDKLTRGSGTCNVWRWRDQSKYGIWCNDRGGRLSERGRDIECWHFPRHTQATDRQTTAERAGSVKTTVSVSTWRQNKNKKQELHSWWNYAEIAPELTHCHGLVVGNLASYSGGPGFKSRPGDWLSWLTLS
jgi:hypothetical protein